MRSVSDGGANDTRAARLRRLWRSHDTNVRTSGLALGRPALVATGQGALRRPAHGMTARELIAMARAARSGSASPMPGSQFDTRRIDRP
ncbi:hypothetical protein ASF27_21025 [Methylobacterium sp. Leaf102]|nr:hypothetical protein ASF27_21025 [Methylobacterium sp. Leaf102]